MSDSRVPGAQVLVNGRAIPGLIAADVSQHNSYQADHYHAQFALYADPAYGLAWWDGLDTTTTFDVQARADEADQYTSMIIGAADRISIDLGRTTVTIEGRDLSSRLIDAKTQETFFNQTSSQIATTLAGRHGLTPDVDATTTRVGRFWSEDHDHIVANQFGTARSEWDLLVFLAQREQFDVWVTGSTLHFKQRPAADPTPFVINYTPPDTGPPTSNAIDIRFERSLTLAKDVVVAIHSYRPRDSRGFTIYDPPTGKTAAQTGKGGVQLFTWTINGLDETTARQLAASFREDITRHERLMTVAMFGQMTGPDPRGQVKLTGTGSTLDQVYWVDSIDRHISFERGFTMDIHCKNHSPASETQIG